MSDSIPVRCTVDRCWDIETKSYKGTELEGDLIEIATQTAEDGSGKIIPVGIVALDDIDAGDQDGFFVSVPVEFIQRI